MSEVEAPTTERPETMQEKAKRFFPDQYKGEIEAPPLAASVEETNEEVSDLTEEVEEAADVAETTEELAVAEESESEESEEVPISSVQELIELNEYDPEWFNSLRIPVKVDGSESEASLSDLVKSYQIQQAAEHRLEEAKTKAKTITQELTEKQESLNAQFSTVAELIINAESVLKKDFEDVDWKGLRQKDPAEFAALQRDFERREAEIQRIKNGASEQYQQYQAQQSEEVQARQQEYLRQEAELLTKAIPEWRDAEKAKTEKSQLAEYLMNQGFSKDDVMAASDHRLIVLARKAMMFDTTATKNKVALKKVAKVPKVTKPGTTKTAEQSSNKNIEKLRQRMLQTGRLEDAHAYNQAKAKARRS